MNRTSTKSARVSMMKKRGEKCERCGLLSELVVHHIKKYSDGGRTSQDNLVMLCQLCHADAHGKHPKRIHDQALGEWGSQNGWRDITDGEWSDHCNRLSERGAK